MAVDPYVGVGQLLLGLDLIQSLVLLRHVRVHFHDKRLYAAPGKVCRFLSL